MRVLTDKELRAWVEENVLQDQDIYWPEETIRAFENHVLETYDEAGLLIEPPEGGKT